MRKIFKIFAISFGILILAVFLPVWILHSPLPEGRSGPEAELLADRMLQAVDKPAWDSMTYMAWVNPYSDDRITWDRQRDWVHMERSGSHAWLDPQRGAGVVEDETGREMVGDKLKEAIEGKLRMFWNDNFWIMAFTKVKDPGTTRQVVDLGDGKNGLLVTYTSGGITPGDSYLWELDESGMPVAWRVWAQILPIGGIRFTWEEWAEFPGGAKYAMVHKLYGMTWRRELVLGGRSLESVGANPGLFDRMERFQKNYP